DYHEALQITKWHEGPGSVLICLFFVVSTSYIERLNATTRLHMCRLTRLTLAFSTKLENFQAAVALHFAYYNLVKRHGTLRCTPAMAAGIEREFWSVGDLVEAAAV